MPIERTITLYKYEELEGKARDKARERIANFNTEFDWHDLVLEDMTERLEGYGFHEPEISYSGFWSQGDGLSFTAKRVHLEKLWEHLQVSDKLLRRRSFFENNALIKLVRMERRYSHKYTVAIDMDFNHTVYARTPRTRALADELIEAIETFRLEVCNTFYEELQNEYEYRRSEEAVREACEANEYLFDDTGCLR